MSEHVWWWLSFTDAAGFRGVALVKGTDLVDAARRAHVLGCNPGGECAGLPAPVDLGAPPERFRDRLLNKATADVASREWTNTPIISTTDIPDEDVHPMLVSEDRNTGN